MCEHGSSVTASEAPRSARAPWLRDRGVDRHDLGVGSADRPRAAAAEHAVAAEHHRADRRVRKRAAARAARLRQREPHRVLGRHRALLEVAEEGGVVVGVLEVAEHRREARGRERVELDELREHALADRARADLLLAELLRAALDAIDEPVERVRADRPLLARLAHGHEDLVAPEVLAALVALHDLRQHLLDALARREAPPALQAFAPAADLGAVAAEPRVDHPIRRVRAVGATHCRPAR